MNKRFSLFFMVILMSVYILSGCKSEEEVKNEETIVSVETYESKVMDIDIKTSLSGKVVPFERANLSPKMPGVVSDVKVKVGDVVKKGDVLFTLDQKDVMNAVRQAQASYNLAVANYENVKSQIKASNENYEKMKTMLEKGIISNEEFQKYEMSMGSMQNTEVLKLQVEQARVMLDNAKSNINDTIIKSPISGVVTSVNVNIGEVSSAGVPGVTVVNIDRVYVDVNVSEHLVNNINSGDSVDILISSLGDEVLSGKITNLSFAPVGNSMTYPAKIELENKDNKIKPGMFAQVDLITQRKENVVVVPASAIVVKEGKNVVFVIESGLATMKVVRVGIDNGEYIEIVEGLVEGEEVVIKGQNYLEEGSKVKIVK
ncbi:efflux RND transporter periplasmic adaptor subunit [Alkalithermobacter paradoxus]|uniref:Macrolide export protein MacA n=1 Tax=Alkalithermobacter paradoxus TaxID=29349 RepID=A0A1V4I5M5_9FIRM|nr:macrolide export protein MacA [[Clostridium] thermoalcaliphilum]